MRKRFALMIAWVILSTIALGWLGFAGLRLWWDEMHMWDRRVDRGFEHVAVGMTRSEVERLMTSSGTKLKQFQLGQEAGFERQYAEAQRSKSAYWLCWRNGIDYVYTVGFDEQDRVTCKASGAHEDKQCTAAELQVAGYRLAAGKRERVQLRRRRDVRTLLRTGMSALRNWGAVCEQARLLLPVSAGR